jgi:hypothetical protein
MDDHRSGDALTDTVLDRELEAALAVDPSPEFEARVLRQVQRERVAAWSTWRWPIAAAVAFVSVIVLGIVLSKHDGAQVVRDESPARRQPTVDSAAQHVGRDPIAQISTAGHAVKPPPTLASRKSAPRQSRPATAASGPELPELLIAADEARALKQLFSNVQKGLVDLSSLRDIASATTALQPPAAIAFPPITFESIVLDAAEEGERQ